MKEHISTALKLLKTEKSLVLATIVRHKGSTPRETGTRFIIKKDGSTVGTIGGGLVEAEVTEKGIQLFESKTSAIVHFDMTTQHLDSGTMICGGDLTILLDFMESTSATISYLQAVEEYLSLRAQGTVVLELNDKGFDDYLISHGLVTDDNSIEGDLDCSEALLQKIKSTIPDSKNPSLMTIDEKKYWVEPLLFPKQLILFGAGHVSQATAKLGIMTEFQTLVVDDRPGLLSREFFPEPVALKTVESFADIVKNLEVDNDCFLVILTRSHSLDKAILAQALRSDAGFLGMIGSMRKRNTIFKTLTDEGFSAEELEQVHSPIGLEIGANTPDEIAVSIIAQLIKNRSG